MLLIVRHMKFALTLSILISSSFVFAAPASPLVELAPVPASQTPLWASQKVLSVKLEANFRELLQKYRTLKPAAGEQSSKSDEAFVTGRLTYQNDEGKDVSLALRLRARGNSSLHDCEFPKLNLEFTDSVRGTIFSKSKKIKIGTHCDDVNGRSGPFNRLRNQLEPFREAMAYRLLETLGASSFKTRPARIDYVFSDDGDKHAVRNAFFLETVAEAEERYSALDASKEFKYAAEKTKPAETILAYLGYMIVGSFDFIVPLCPKDAGTIWNMKAFKRASGEQFLLPYDLDLARIVTTPREAMYLEFYLPLLKQDCMQPKDVVAVKAHVLSKSDELYRVIDETDFTYVDIETGELRTDDEGREKAKAQLTDALTQIKAHL